MKIVKGFIPVTLTPFNEDGSINFDGLTRLTNWYLKNGAKGLFANCQPSEMFALLPEHCEHCGKTLRSWRLIFTARCATNPLRPQRRDGAIGSHCERCEKTLRS
ncbi:MAG: dihydrodipicolinate synthase family protein [Niabella sp.]|nr:dihydrodipicolinate synthase family protein [Niabella sp.]